MKKFLFLFICISSLSLHSFANSEVSIELQWEESKNASYYEIQLLDLKGQVVKTVESKSSLIKLSAPVQRYKIRGRYTTRLGNKSPWSKEEILEVTPAKPKVENAEDPFSYVHSSDPENKSEVSKNSAADKIQLKWKPVALAEKYKVKIYSKDKKKLLQEFITEKNILLFDVVPGEFVVSITSIGAAQIESEETFLKKPLVVDRKKLVKPVVQKQQDPKKMGQFSLSFEKSDLFFVAGELYYSAFLSDQWTIVEKNESLQQFSTLNLKKPGKYKLTYWATQANALDSEKSTEEFVIKPKEEDLN